MLKDLILQDFKKAFKNQEKLKLSVLRMLKADFVKKQQEKRYQLKKEFQELEEDKLGEQSILSDEEVLGVIISKIKRSKESVAGFEQAGRTDLIEKEKAEIQILQKYLPEQLSEEEIKKIVQEAIIKVGAENMKDIGMVMVELMPRIKGKAEGSLVIKIVRSALT